MSASRPCWTSLLLCTLGTTGQAAPPPDATPETPWLVRVRAIDETTQVLIPNAHVTLQLDQDKKDVRALTPDASGEFDAEFPTRTPPYCYIKVRAEGYVPMRAFWSTRGRFEPDPLPEEFTFEMARGTTVGGRVVDEKGQPVAGATVWFGAGDSQSHPGRRAEQSFYREQFTTDDQGRWRCDFAPPHMNSGSIRVDHSDFAFDPVGHSIDNQIEKLRDGTLTTFLRQGFTVSGNVIDPDGKPVEGAVLAIGRGDFRPFPRTDANGRFEFRRITRNRTTVTVLKPGFGPQTKIVPELSPDANAAPDAQQRVVDFQLTAGDTLRVRVVDSAGRPIQGVDVFPDNTQEMAALAELAQFGIPTETDADGIWEWTWAPAGEQIEFGVSVPGYAPAPDFKLVPNDPHTETVTLFRSQVITGTVVDADTKAPIDEFVVQKGFEGSGNSPDGVFWDTVETRGRDGLYYKEIRIRSKSFKYRAKADGYEPAVSRSIPYGEGEVRVDFELRRVRDEK